MLERVVNRVRWWSYTRNRRHLWQLWDSMGGGKYAEKQLEPFMLLSRPSFNPVPLTDPVFSTPRFAPDGPQHKCRDFTEYVYHVRKPCYIESEFGYVIMEPAVLLPGSLAWSNMAREPDEMQYFSGVPSFSRYKEVRQGKRPVRREKIVVSLRHVFDSNYGHCLIQLMPTLLLLDECGVSPEIPIVVSPLLGRSPFFQEMIQRGALRKRRWIVQEDEYIQAEELIFARMEWPSRNRLNQFLDAIEASQGDLDGQRRLFILRRSRLLENMDSLVPILKDLEFDLIRPEELTFSQQAKLFSQAQTVCGVLGAALTNTIFRRDAPMQMLEICSSMEKDPFFYALAKTCGFSYQCLVGSPYAMKDRENSFYVDPKDFETLLNNALSETDYQTFDTIL